MNVDLKHYVKLTIVMRFMRFMRFVFRSVKQAPGVSGLCGLCDVDNSRCREFPGRPVMTTRAKKGALLGGLCGYAIWFQVAHYTFICIQNLKLQPNNYQTA